MEHTTDDRRDDARPARVSGLVPRALAMISAMAMALAGCDMVVLDAPFGESPAALDAAAIDGVWYRAEDDAVPFHARVTGDGEVLIAAIGGSAEAGGEVFVLEQIPLTLTRIDGALYVSGPADEVVGGGYYFGRVASHDTEQWTILVPDVDAFEKALRLGSVEGEVQPSDHVKVVRVTAESALAFVRANPDQAPWSDQRTIVLRRFDPLHGLD